MAKKGRSGYMDRNTVDLQREKRHANMLCKYMFSNLTAGQDNTIFISNTLLDEYGIPRIVVSV